MDGRFCLGEPPAGHGQLGQAIARALWPQAERPAAARGRGVFAYAVVVILDRQRELLQGLEVRSEGAQLADPPHTFTDLHLHYAVRGSVNPDQLQQAIAPSEEKYCSVATTLRPAVNLTSGYEILPGDSQPAPTEA